MATFEVTYAERCTICQCAATPGKDVLAVPETHIPGLELDGNPLRFYLFHMACAPDFARDYHDFLKA
jgi:hypothetical protein